MPDTYTATDPKTGRTITFEWNDPAPPTDADVEEVFAAAGPVAPAKSLSGFASNVLGDLGAIPRTIADAAQMVNRYNPLSLGGQTTMANSLLSAFKGQVPDDPMAQAGAALVQNPGAPFRAAKDKLTHPVRTAGELVDYAYDKPVSAALDASAVFGGGAGVLRAMGRAPRVASALATASRLTDPVAGAVKGVGTIAKTAGRGGEVTGEALMRKALNMSDADMRARGPVERTALERRIAATPEGDAKLGTLLEPIGQRQAAAIADMPEFVVSHDRLPRTNALVEQTQRIRGSDPARYDAAVKNRVEALTDPNFTSDRPVMDGMRPTEGRFPQPVSGQLLHENKQALQHRAANAKAYIAHPNPGAEVDAVTARAGDYRQILNDASPEYAAANKEFEPLMALQEQLRERALFRGGHDVPYGVGLGLQAARGNVVTPAMGVLTGLALKNPRLASALAQGAFDVGQGMQAAGRGVQTVAPRINQLDALQRAILRQRANQDGQ